MHERIKHHPDAEESFNPVYLFHGQRLAEIYEEDSHEAKTAKVIATLLTTLSEFDRKTLRIYLQYLESGTAPVYYVKIRGWNW